MLNEFINKERPTIVRAIRRHIRMDVKDMRRNPSLYKESPDSEPSIDIRLCIDPVSDVSCGFDWMIRVGSVDFDQFHSMYCGASSYGPDTRAEALFDELVEQILEQEMNSNEGVTS